MFSIKNFHTFLQTLNGLLTLRSSTNGEIDPGPRILREVQKVVDSMKMRKAESSNGVVVEMIETAGEFGIEKIIELANRIYSTG